MLYACATRRKDEAHGHRYDRSGVVVVSKAGDSRAAGRRIGSPTSKTRAVIVDSAEQLMAEQGHASITYRSVAARADVTAGLVQYYFPTLEDLFVSVLQRGTDRALAAVDRAAQGGQPLRELWAYASTATGASMIVEFMSAANHRKAIWDQIGEGGEQVRQAWLNALADHWGRYGISEADLPPAAVLFMLTAIGRMARLEEAFGTHTGHEEAIALVERFLDAIEPQQRDA
jgi:TetR/AcrR family transcriptional regulator, transcriptional repressor for nem operon